MWKGDREGRRGGREREKERGRESRGKGREGDPTFMTKFMPLVIYEHNAAIYINDRLLLKRNNIPMR